MRTTCAGCVFSARDNGVQVGCVLGKLEKYEKLGKVIKPDNASHFEIDAYCNTCRDITWLEKRANYNPDQVFEEIRLCYSLVIFDQIEAYDQILEQIKATKEWDTKPSIVRVYFKTAQDHKIKWLVDECNHLGVKFAFDVLLEESSTEAKFRLDCFHKKIKETYAYCVSSEQMVDDSLPAEVEFMVNEELAIIAWARHDESIMGSMICPALFWGDPNFDPMTISNSSKVWLCEQPQ